MTAKEALDTLDKTVIGNLELKIALSAALEKQIPKSPVLFKYGYCDGNTCEVKTMPFPMCPTCWENGNRLIWDSLIDNTVAYCRRCGQAIDWGEWK